MAGEAPEYAEELLSAVPVEFRTSKRPRRDGAWTWLYLLTLAACTAGGLYGAVNRSDMFWRAFQGDYLRHAGNCPYDRNEALQVLARDTPQTLDIPAFFRQAGLWLLVSAGGAVVAGALYLELFKRVPGVMTRGTIGVQVAIPAALGLAALLSGQLVPGLVSLAMAALAAAVFWFWRREIELCVRLLQLAANGLADNSGLLAFVLLAKVALLAVVLPLLLFQGLAFTNGRVAPNSRRLGSARCVDGQGAPVPCCQWQPDPWVGPYLAFASVALLWSALLASELRVFTISGTIAQWYFAAPGAGRGGFTLRALRFGLGPSFGSLAFGSAILTLISMARSALQKAQEERRRGGQASILFSLLACLLQAVWGLVECLTKFATVRCAITGEGFLAAGRAATALLSRNALKAYGVWWFPPMVLQGGAFLVSAAWGGALGLAAYLAWRGHPTPGQEAGLLGALAFLMTWMLASFFACVLLDCVNALFMCYAMDKDTRSVTNAPVHEVFSQVPCGVAVEQPGGEYAYGAPLPPHQQPTQQPQGPQHPMARPQQWPSAPSV